MGKKQAADPPLELKRFQSVSEIRSAIAKLTRRVHEVEALHQNATSYDAPEVDPVRAGIVKSILEVFGEHSPEYREYRYHRIWHGPQYINMSDEGLQRGFEQGIQHTLQILNGLIRSLREQELDFQQRSAESEHGEMDRGALFIGHGRSREWLALQAFLHDQLGLRCVEFNSESTAGVPTAERLSQLLETANFAFLVMTAEDQTADGQHRARENVVHEAGLFQGRLGFRRAIVLLEEGCTEFSNIHGLGQIRFSKGNIDTCFHEIRRVLDREGLLSKRSGNDAKAPARE